MLSSKVAKGLLVAVGAVNAAPAIAALAPDRIETLYGVEADNPDLELLLRHRGVLLGLVGASLIGGAFSPCVRSWAVGACAANMVSYVALTSTVGGTNEKLQRVRTVDVAALGALAVAFAVDYAPGRTKPVS